MKNDKQSPVRVLPAHPAGRPMSFFKKREAEVLKQSLDAVARIDRLDEVVRDKDEQIVSLNRMLCDTIAERDAALREAEALQQLHRVNAQLRNENTQLMAQLQSCEALIEQLNLRIRAFEVEREPAPSVGSESNGPRSLYAPSVGARSARYSGSLAGSLSGGASGLRLAPSERARMHDVATRAMLLK
uniref:Uncharacterized protein n=2 Tax=Diacronema lutheri TaxID=2081491 RepID=A0A7R9YLQ4_DIALT